MKRRDFITLLGSVTVAGSIPAAAQTKRPPVVALIAPIIPVTDTVGPLAGAFILGLRDLGWINGTNIIIERHSAEGDQQRAATILADLLARGVDVIVLGTARWLQDAALRATRTIPLVAVFTENPVTAGLTKSLARPGGNLTGVTFTTGPEFQDKRLQLLRELVPSASRIAFLATTEVLEQYRGVAHPSGVTIVPVQVNATDEYQKGFDTIIQERAEALMVSGGVHLNNVGRVVAFATESRLPAIYPWREAADAGGLISYGSSVPGVWRQTAKQVDLFLKGAKPGDVPTEQPTKFELLINMKTAKVLSLHPPASLLATADEVIE
jgi:putative ABC transport system substrate-binding protein